MLRRYLAAAFLLVGLSSCDSSKVAPDARTGEGPTFQESAATAGIDFTHEAGQIGDYFFPQIMGAGCALFDFDQDGDLDAYLVNGASSVVSTAANDDASRTANRLYRQDPGGQFVDVTATSGLGDRGYGMGVAVGDVNNDGRPDVFVTNFGPDRLYLNDGEGVFSPCEEDGGIDTSTWSASACFFDYDRDGWLDLFITSYVDYAPRRCIGLAGGEEDYCSPNMFEPAGDRLFRNETGDSNSEGLHVHFRDVTTEAGIAAGRGAGLGVVSGDFNGDGWPDIYVANDQSANFLWSNQRDGTFRDEGLLRGCANDSQGRSQAGMGVAIGDVNEDRRPDILVTHLDGEPNALYLSDEFGFLESSGQTGLATRSFARTGFGTSLADLDCDGTLDLLIVNGRVTRAPKQSGDRAKPPLASPAAYWSDYAQQNQIFLRGGEGEFKELVDRDSSFLNAMDVSRGLAAGDIDNDGDIDYLVTNTAGKAGLYQNEFARRGAWLSVRAIAPQWGSRDAYGAVVTVTAGTRRWRRTVGADGSYLSSRDPRVHFGLGAVSSVDAVEVVWPDGRVEVFSGSSVNRQLVLAHGSGQTK